MRLLFLQLLVLLSACAGPTAQGEGPAPAGDFNPDPRPMAKTLVYECSDREFISRVGPGEMAIWLEDRYLILSQVRAASGSKYVEGDVTLWAHGDEVLLIVGQERYTDCELNRLRAPWEDARRRGVDFRASGNEPGWHLEIKRGRQMLFVGDYGARKLLMPAPEVAEEEAATRYSSASGSDALTVLVSDTPCHDTMMGTAYPATVEVQLNGKFYQGCGMALDYPWE